jgi:hypothetical protein
LPAWGHWDPALLIPLEGARVSGDAGFALEVALGEVLYNAQVEAAKSEGQVAVGITTRTLGGRDYVVIGVENPCTSPEVHRFQHELYRLPFRRAHQGRKHLGAFIAGSVLRAAGGELSFVLAPEADGQRFTARTRIEVEIHRGGPGEPF